MANFEEQIREEWKKYQKERDNRLLPTVMLLGISGAGKSSLINTVFGEEVAKVSNTTPETRGMNIYEGHKHGKNINIIDTAGYEMNEGNSFYDSFISTIKEGITIDKKKSQIHIIWYCISILNERIEDMDLQLLKRLYSEESLKERVCVVFTKCDEDDEEGTSASALANVLSQELNFKIDSFQVSNDPEIKLELNDLLTWSKDKLDDDDLRAAFVSSQMVNLEMKAKEAVSLIKKYVLSAASTAASPIPGSDAPVLVALQTKMIYDIVDIYDIGSLSHIPMSTVIDIIISQLGKKLAWLLLSIIPFAKVINSAVAGSMTYLLGQGISKICYKACERALKGKIVEWDRLFDSEAVNIILDAILKDIKNNKNYEDKWNRR